VLNKRKKKKKKKKGQVRQRKTALVRKRPHSGSETQGTEPKKGKRKINQRKRKNRQTGFCENVPKSAQFTSNLNRKQRVGRKNSNKGTGKTKMGKKKKQRWKPTVF